MSTRWVRSERVLSRTVPSGVMVLPVDAQEPFLLMGSGAVLWDVLATPVTTDEAAGALAALFGITPDLAEADIVPCLSQLCDRGAVSAAP